MDINSWFAGTYARRIYLKDDNIKVTAQNNVATLTGTVATESHKQLAQNIIQARAGIISVNNKLVTEAEAASENKDKWIGRKVKLALLFHHYVNGVMTRVDVEDGVVTLKGAADSIAQKELTAEYAKDIEGVISVKNEITVTPEPAAPERSLGEKIDDASVNAQIIMVLLTHRSTRAANAKVESRDGEVTVTGIASSEAEKALVTKLVTDIHGVTAIKNQMTVKELTTA